MTSASWSNTYAPLVFWPLPNGVDVETWERLFALGAAGAIVLALARPWTFPERLRYRGRRRDPVHETADVAEISAVSS